jgi:hypothetical protein
MLVELGILRPLANLSYDELGILATDSLLKSTWDFLDQHNFQLHTRDFDTFPCQGDCYIMEAILPYVSSDEQLLWVNKCRLYLRVIYLSDIVTGDGTSIEDIAWLGSMRMHPQREESWPNQQNPPMRAWLLWRKVLKSAFVSRGRRLRKPLCLWLDGKMEGFWFLCLDSFSLYSCFATIWRSHTCVNPRSVRPLFEKGGIRTCRPKNLHRATTYQQGNFIVLTGHCGIISKQIVHRTSFKNFLLNTSKEQWWHCGLSLLDNGEDTGPPKRDCYCCE